MTSRERVREVLRGNKPDRVPNGLGATINTGMHLLAYERLLKILDVQDPAPRMMTFEANALFDPQVSRALESDMVSLGIKITPARYWGPASDADWKEVAIWGRKLRIPRAWETSVDAGGQTWLDGLNWDFLDFNVPTSRPVCRLKCPQGAYYFDAVAPGDSLDVSHDDANLTPDMYHPPTDYPDEWLRSLEESARWLYENTEYSVVCDEMINDLQVAPGGLDRWWMRLVTEPSVAHEFLDKACDAGLRQLQLVEQAVGSYADMNMIAHDFGDLRGVSIGPELWREIYKPHYRRLFEGWRRITKMKIGMHSCGSIVDILEDLVECGLQVINPVQLSARGMDPKELKRRFGTRLVFYGGSYDAVAIPPETAPDEVYRTVQENIRTLGRGGGYLFAGVHNIQWNVPDSHLRAILAAFRDCRAE
jgi:uroporphyrinogen decarboxylase